MKVTQKTHLHYRIQHIVFIILLLGCIGFAGWLSNTYNQRSDWTAGNRHSLSNETLDILKGLPLDIVLRSYQADNPSLNKAINEILNRYKSNNANFSFKLINPDIFIEQAKVDKVTRYGQTVIEYNGKIELIENLSEESITNALIRLHRNQPPKLLFLTQHNERNINDSSLAGYSQLKTKLTEKGFDVSNINLLQQTLSVKNTVLVLASINKPLLDTELIKLQKYIEKGGALLWLQDPMLDSSQLALTNQLNINFIDGVIVDNNQEVSRMLQLSHAAVIPILEYKLHPITKKMQYYTLFTTASAISPTNTSTDWITSDLLITSDSSWSETGGFDPNIEFNKENDLAGPLSIGIAQQRQTLSHNIKTSQRIVVIGDTDFLSNMNLGHGANLDFILNTFNWLSLNDSLIAISPKNAPDLQLNLSAPAAAIIGLTFLIALPMFFFITGAIIWLKRKKR